MASEMRSSAHKPRSSSRTRVVLGVLCLVILFGVLGAQYYLRHQPETLDSRLRGDSEDATGALEERLATTPAAQHSHLLLKYAQEESPALRYAAVDALGNMKGTAVADQIEQAMTDSSSLVRQRAVEVLPKVDQERGLHLLLAGLADEDVWIREAAVSQISTLSSRRSHAVDQRAIPMLIRSLGDSSTAVPSLAVAALNHLTGKSWKFKMTDPPAVRQSIIARWRTWAVQDAAAGKVPAEYQNIPPILTTRQDAAPDFHLTDLDGHGISRDSQKGRLTLLNFWGSWCPPCQMEIPDLVKLDNIYRSRGLDVVGVALSEKDAPTLKAWCAAHGVKYRQALADEAITEPYGKIHEVPVSVLIDRNGKIRYRWEGERDFGTFRAAVERVL